MRSPIFEYFILTDKIFFHNEDLLAELLLRFAVLMSFCIIYLSRWKRFAVEHGESLLFSFGILLL